MPKFTPRERKHRKIARAASTTAGPNIAAADTNALTLSTTTTTTTNNDDHASRKSALKAALTPSHPISSKKRKRLDKYVETKLRREETLAIMRRLEESQKGVDRSGLVSAKALGRKGETRREEWRRAVKEGRGDEVLRKEPLVRQEQEEEEEDDEDDEDDEEDERRANNHVSRQRGQNAESSSAVAPTALSTAVVPKPSGSLFGSGLKRPLEVDADGKPIIKERKRRRTGPLVFDVPQRQITDAGGEEPQPEWTGFSDADTDEPGIAASHDNVLESSDGESLPAAESEDDDESEEGESVSSEVDGEADADDSSDAASDTSASESGGNTARKARTSAFKAWAEQQRNSTLDFAPSSTQNLPVITPEIKANFTPRAPESDPLPESLSTTSALAADRKPYAVPVTRNVEIQAARLELPVLAEEQRIMEAVFGHDVVIISGATGSGKTTQVPQFLYEHGFGSSTSPTTKGMIGVTQPRRVAAVSMAKRVAEELGPDHGNRVGYQIRFDSAVGRGTAVKFMTDGVLLREMSTDFALRKYSAIVIDEAHERTVNTDILISLLSRCITIRRTLATEQPDNYSPLKLIIMSATLRVEDFRSNLRLFSVPPPIVEAEGRQFDVTIHWARRTSADWVEEAFKKICRGHRKLPPGGMLVFLTGQSDIRLLMRRLADVFKTTEASAKSSSAGKMKVEAGEMVVEEGDVEVEDVPDREENTEDIEGDEDSADESSDDDFDVEPDPNTAESGTSSEVQKIHLLPLYSQLPSSQQLNVFDAPPPGSRTIILATNIAETSLTIPGIRYVFDCGRAKSRTWNTSTGVQSFKTTWISQASASQRSGRAGRTQAGHCWRLYSSAVFEDAMPSFAQPEILRANLEGVVLQLKALGVDNISNFPWPTPPDLHALAKAESVLRYLGALDMRGIISKTGRELIKYPLAPRFAGMLRLGILHGVVKEVVAMVASLDVPELVMPWTSVAPPLDHQDDNERTKIRTIEDEAAESAHEALKKRYNAAMARLARLDFDKRVLRPQSDGLRLLTAVTDYTSSTSASIASTEQEKENKRALFCRENFLREKGMKEVLQLQEQLLAIVQHVAPHALPSSTSVSETKEKAGGMGDKKVALLKQILAAGFIDQIALRADLLPRPPEPPERKAKRAIDVRYKTLFSSSSSKGPDDEDEDEDDGFVYIHPSSLLARLPPSAVPRYIIYARLQRSAPSSSALTARPKVRMHPLTPVSAEQVSVLARGTSLLEVGKPLGRIEVLPASEKSQERRECEVMLSLAGEKGMVGWPLGRKRVVQRRVVGRGWEVEKWM